MSEPDEQSPLSNHQPDQRLVNLYEEATRQDDQMIEFLCPAFASLKASKKRYTDAKKLGEGSLKTVYQAYDNRAHRWVAMATLKKGRGLRYYDHFIHEAWLIAGLKHPNIIKVHDVGADELGRPFFTMDLKGDVSFEDLIRREPSIPLSDLLEIFCKVCDAVAYAHARKVIHLDLKPENIQCDSFGEVLVCDWGLGQCLEGYARHNNDEEDEPLPRLDYGDDDERILGSLGYMAPEQVTPNANKAECTDIFALGCILHCILCGEPPFTGTKDEVLAATALADVRSLIDRFPERQIPEGLQSVALKALALQPKDRYQSAHDLKVEIQKYLAGFATKAENPSFYRQAALFFNRNKVPVTISALAFGVIITLSVLFAQHLGKQQLATKEERERANLLLSEVTVLSTENAELFKETSVTKKELADELSNTAKNAKNFGFFNNPAQAILSAEQLIEMALALDPTNRNARWQQIQINVVKLNFKDTLADPLIETFPADSATYILAKEFPDYHFDRETRPTAEQVIAIYDRAAELKLADNSLLERIFCYNYDVIGNRVKQDSIIEALLNWMNPGSPQLHLDYDWHNRLVKVQTIGDLRLRLTINGSSRRSLIRFLAIHKLILSCNGSFHLEDLDTMGIESLDLTDCAQLFISDRIRLPYLKKVYVRPDQISDEDLRQSIRKSQDFEIIRMPAPSSDGTS